MARKCKCKICGRQLTTDIAYKVTKGKTNNYYCSEEEYKSIEKEKEAMDKCKITIAMILEVPYCTPLITKYINKLNEHYTADEISFAFKKEEKQISRALQKDFRGNDFTKYKYIFTIVENNIYKHSKEYKKQQEDMNRLFEPEVVENIDIINDDTDLGKPRQINNKSDRDISVFLDDDDF